MNYKKIFLYLLLIPFPLSLLAQQKKADSLKKVLEHSVEDTSRVVALNHLSEAYYHSGQCPRSDSAAKLALQLAQKLGYRNGMEQAYRNLGLSYRYEGNYPEALKNQLKYLEIVTADSDKPGEGLAYKEIGLIYYDLGKYTDALQNLERSLSIFKKAGDKGGMASALGVMGFTHYSLAAYKEALNNYTAALEIDKGLNNEASLAADYSNAGLVYEAVGDYPAALKNQFASLDIEEKLGNKAGVAAAYGNIGNIYNALGNYQESLKYQQKCLDIDKELNNKKGVGVDHVDMGITYINLKKYDEALKSQQEALKIAGEIGDNALAAAAYGNIGSVFTEQGNYPEALKNISLTLKLEKELGNKDAVGNAYNDLGGLFIKQKNYARAKLYLDSAIDIEKNVGDKTVLKEAYQHYIMIDSANGSYKNAFIDYKNYVAYRDSLNNDDNTRKLVQEQMQHEFEKRQAEQKAAQDKKDFVALADKKKQRIISVAIAGGLLLALIFAGFVFRSLRVTRKQKEVIEVKNRETEEQKKVIEEKNKDILDSITYAKRLQDAILPPLSVIKQHLPESFVLYKPKDIVAGDFYWMEKVNDTILVAACDCTGHGVPGAMVSVVCSNALNRALNEFKITEPGKLLDKTRELVLETYGKSEGEVKDGMDCSFCSINTKTKQVTWSGAYNPLWYIANGEMKEITGDKQPIGKTDNPKPFTTHTIIIPPSSEGRGEAVLYLFTDGYADQFGGPKGKKFKYKQLQEKLLAISNRPMEEQKKLLEETLENWKGSLEQVDDILIIGIKV